MWKVLLFTDYLTVSPVSEALLTMWSTCLSLRCGVCVLSPWNLNMSRLVAVAEGMLIKAKYVLKARCPCPLPQNLWTCYVTWQGGRGVELRWNLVCVCELLSHVGLFATPQTVARQAPLSMDFSRQEYWSGLPFSSPGDLSDPGTEPMSPALQEDYLPSEPPGKPKMELQMELRLPIR